MRLYPEVVESGVSEFWHAKRQMDAKDLDLLPPMWADVQKARHRHFYVKELAQLVDGTFAVPMVWYLMKGEMHADAYVARLNTEVSGCAFILQRQSYRQIIDCLPHSGYKV